MFHTQKNLQKLMEGALGGWGGGFPNPCKVKEN